MVNHVLWSSWALLHKRPAMAAFTHDTACPGSVPAGTSEKACVTVLHIAHAMAKASTRCSGIGSHAFGMIRTLSSCRAHVDPERLFMTSCAYAMLKFAKHWQPVISGALYIWLRMFTAHIGSRLHRGVRLLRRCHMPQAGRSRRAMPSQKAGQLGCLLPISFATVRIVVHVNGGWYLLLVLL